MQLLQVFCNLIYNNVHTDIKIVVIISERKLSASVSVSAEMSAETDTEMSVSAVFRHFGIGRNVGLSRYRNFGRHKQLFRKKTWKNHKTHTQKKKNFPAFIKRKRLISSNLTLKKLITDTYQVFPTNIGEKNLSSLLFKKNFFRFWYRYRFRYRYVESFGIGSYVADTEIADISVSAGIWVSVVH